MSTGRGSPIDRLGYLRRMPSAAEFLPPSAILRLREDDEREAGYAGFVADLEALGSALRDAAR